MHRSKGRRLKSQAGQNFEQSAQSSFDPAISEKRNKEGRGKQALAGAKLAWEHMRPKKKPSTTSSPISPVKGLPDLPSTQGEDTVSSPANELCLPAFHGSDALKSAHFGDACPPNEQESTSIDSQQAHANSWFEDNKKDDCGEIHEEDSSKELSGQAAIGGPHGISASIEISEIGDIIRKAASDCMDLRGPEGESPKQAVFRILKEYKEYKALSALKLQQNLQQTKTMRTELGKTKNQLRDSNTRNVQLDEELKSNRDKYLAERKQDSIQSQRVISELRRENSERCRRHEHELNGERDRSQRDLNQRNAEIAKLRRDKDDLSRTHASLLRKAQDSHQEQLDRLKLGYEDELRGLREENASKKHQHDLAIQQWENHVQEVEVAMEQRHKQELRKEQRAHNQEIEEMQGIIDEWRQKAQAVETRILQEAKDKETKRERQFHAEKLKLLDEIREYKGALVARDHFKGLTDPEISTRFKRLAGQVEELSRVKWDDEQEAKWPFTDRTLERYNRNTRKIKQQIVQNSLWALLHAYVLCSPFRIMGEECADLDKEWLHVYRSGSFSVFSSAEASLEAEKRRYEAAKIFFDQMEHTGQTLDAEASRRSREVATAAAVDAILRPLGNIAVIGLKERQAVNDLVRSCGKVWLEICAQRFRLLVSLPVAVTDVLSAPRGSLRTLKLVIKPELKRFGNAQGQNMTREEVIAGWKGDFITYE